MWCHGDIVRSDVSDERVASIFRVERINTLGTTSAVTVRLNHTTKKNQLH
jgi:hypothetical protein